LVKNKGRSEKRPQPPLKKRQGLIESRRKGRGMGEEGGRGIERGGEGAKPKDPSKLAPIVPTLVQALRKRKS